jgi:Zn-dependent peptidase ImmA (M78 family)/transcriptional regulator with XRE-family HTH domain
MFNPEMLVLARVRHAQSQQELARHAGITQPILSRIEAGQREPTPTEVEALAAALSVPPTFFARDSRERFVVAPPLFRLKRKKVSARRLDQLNGWMASQAMHVRDMLRHVEIEPSLPEPYALDGLTPGEAAAAIRRMWLLRPGPLWNLTGLLEASGVLVIEVDPPVPEFDGCAYRAPHLPACIFVARHQPPDRRRFTLAHELAHLVLHDDLHDDNEAEAHEFAAELLVPRADFVPTLHARPSLSLLLTLKITWGVSMWALVRRLVDVERITPNQATRLYQEMSALGWRKSEPGELRHEVPQLLREVVTAMRRDLGYTSEELARLLREIPATVDRLYPARAQPLQLA